MPEVDSILKQRGVALVRKLADVNVLIREELRKAADAEGGSENPGKYANVAESVRKVYRHVSTSMKTISQSWRDKSGSAVHGDADTLREGKHEWIPTNMIPYVVLMSARWNDVSWLGLAEALRCATPGVIYKAHTRIAGTSAANATITIAGHVGGIYDARGTALTTGMGPWHDGLREILARNLNLNGNNMANFGSELHTYVDDTLWGGELADTWKRGLPCNFFVDAARTKPWGATMGEMGEEIRVRKTLALTLIDNVTNAFQTMSAPARNNEGLARKLNEDQAIRSVYQLLKDDLSATDVDDE